jgi:hypothetical protein
MSPSSSTSEEFEPFLDLEKPSTPRSPALIALSILRKGARIPVRLCRTSNFNISSILLPSFLQPPRTEKTRVSPTAWLDGVRGIAAFIVYIRHFASATHPDIQYGFGTDASQRSIMQLPFFHLLTAGPAMVAVFFIVSGYALSWGPLRALHQQSIEKCLHRLSSGTFRRAARLFLPGIVSTFIVMLCIQAGLYTKGYRSVNPEDMPGFMEPGPPLLLTESLGVQMENWFQCTWRWLQIWVPENHIYDVHLWTIPVEFRCSMILFMSLVAFARTPPRIRLGLIFCCTLYCYFTNFWEGWLFFFGSFLAQLKLLRDDANECFSPVLNGKCSGDVGKRETKTSSSDLAKFFLFIAGLYLLSAPDDIFGKHIFFIRLTR